MQAWTQREPREIPPPPSATTEVGDELGGMGPKGRGNSDHILKKKREISKEIWRDDPRTGGLGT